MMNHKPINRKYVIRSGRVENMSKYEYSFGRKGAVKDGFRLVHKSFYKRIIYVQCYGFLSNRKHKDLYNSLRW